MRGQRLHRPRPIESRPLILEDLPRPAPQPGEVLLRVKACGVCRTDLHLVEGDLRVPQLPRIPGHQVVGEVVEVGAGAERLAGARLGVPWLGWACGECAFCQSGQENLCPQARFTGFHRDGGFAEFLVAREDFVLALPAGIDEASACPLLCAGIIGYRSLRRAEVVAGETVGLIGFGASAHLTLPVALDLGCRVVVFTRSEGHRRLARELGATWAGAVEDGQAGGLDRAVLFAPDGGLVPQALRLLRPGGTLAINAIHLTPIPKLDYDTIYGERTIRTVANATRDDGREFLALAERLGLRPTVAEYALADAHRALEDLKHSRLSAAAALVP